MFTLLLLAFALGFVGYLPPGNINLTVVQLRVGENRFSWQLFILFAAVMEFIYCFGCIWGVESLLKQTQLVVYLNWSAVFIFLGLGILSLMTTGEASTASTFSSGIKRGVLIAIFNPLQVPFWLVWGVYVLQDNWLRREAASIALFSLVCSIGTVAVLYMYAEAGKKLVERLNVNKTLQNRIIGSLLIFLAIYQSIRLLVHG
jgi:threonine/homoserine/homoserine lactone efflux protein